MASDEVPYLHVKLGSPGNTGDVTGQVLSVDVEDVDRGCDKATVLMTDTDSVNSDAGTEVLTLSVELGWETEHALIFEGPVRRPRASAGSSQRVELVAYDPSIKMNTPRDPALTATHTGTLEKILKDIAARNTIPFGKVEIDPMPTFTEDKPLRQGTMTDFELVQLLAWEYGARAFVEVNVTGEDTAAVQEAGGSARFYFTSETVLLSQKPLGKLMYCRGMGRILEFDYKRVASGASPSTSTTVTNPETGEPDRREGPPPASGPEPAAPASRSSRVAAMDGEASARAYEAAVQLSAEAPVQIADLRARREAAGLPSDPDLAKRLVRQDKTRILGFSGRGLAIGTVFLRAKGSVEIDGLATWATGRWYAHRVNHRVERQRAGGRNQLTYRTAFEVTR